MSRTELLELLEHAWQFHSFHSPFERKHGLVVKHVDPHIDMRDGAVFSVTFRGFGWEKSLGTGYETRDLPESLFERCLAFLDQDTVNLAE